MTHEQEIEHRHVPSRTIISDEDFKSPLKVTVLIPPGREVHLARAKKLAALISAIPVVRKVPVIGTLALRLKWLLWQRAAKHCGGFLYLTVAGCRFSAGGFSPDPHTHYGETLWYGGTGDMSDTPALELLAEGEWPFTSFEVMHCIFPGR